MPWAVAFAASAERTLARLSERVAAAMVEFIVGPLSEDPTMLGKPLRREMSGYWSARRGSYRVVYRLDEDGHLLRVVRIEHRSDVYRRR